jgi:mannose-6-phosphate isomerase-like protein (cupin superfamily)
MVEEIGAVVKEIKSIQRSIDQLLDEGLLTINKDTACEFSDGGKRLVGLKPLLNKEECYVAFGTFPEAGATFPPHLHYGCMEYFIVVKGSMVIDLGQGVRRIMKERSCAAVEENMMHFIESLEPNTEYVVISIPLDKHIQKLFDRVNIATDVE